MICPPCSGEADLIQQLGIEPNAHDPAICRDAALNGHGCPCEHGHIHLPEDGRLLILDAGVLARLSAQPSGTWTKDTDQP